MTDSFAQIAVLAPLALLAAGALSFRETGSTAARLSIFAGYTALGAAALALLAFVTSGAGTTVLTAGPISIHYDALSAGMLLMVTFIGLIVLRFSRSYLAGDPGQSHFFGWMALSIGTVLVLILSGNLVQFALAWILTSLALDKLLLFRGDRIGARRAALKKFVASRIGDVALIGAAVLLWQSFGSLSFAVIFEQAQQTEATGAIHGAAILLALAALTKSAQFPVHGWLTEVMETPTPVSALLHAGIVNAGGFLILRFSEVMVLSLAAMDLLVMVGGFTALFGAAVMMTQTSVKVQLAWSTVAQMGFMLMQCGLGAFHLAALHIVAHSLYKAHAFLSSGSAAETIAAAEGTSAPVSPGRLALAFGAALVVVSAVGAMTGIGASGIEAGALALAAVLTLGITQVIARAMAGQPMPALLGLVALLAAAATVFYALLNAAAGVALGAALAQAPAGRTWFDLGIVVLVTTGFAAILLLQESAHRLSTAPRYPALHRALREGFYVNAAWDRLLARALPATFKASA